MVISRRNLIVILLGVVILSPLIYVSWLYVLAYSPSMPTDNVEIIVIGFEDGTRRVIDPSTREGRRLLSQCRSALCHVDAACTCFITGSDVREQVESNSSYVKIVYSEAQTISFFGTASLANYKPNTTEVWFFLSGYWYGNFITLNGYCDKWQDTIWGMYGVNNLNRWIQISK